MTHEVKMEQPLASTFFQRCPERFLDRKLPCESDATEARQRTFLGFEMIVSASMPLLFTLCQLVYVTKDYGYFFNIEDTPMHSQKF